MSSYYRSILNVQGVPLDADSVAFLTAAKPFFISDYYDLVGLTESAFDKGISDFYVALKDYLIYNKLPAFYPTVGATAGAHKFNGKDPRNLNAAFRLEFFGGITHSTGGMLSNATNGYANTHLLRKTNLSRNNIHMSYYSRTNASTTFASVMGVIDSKHRNNLGIRRTFFGIADRTVSDISNTSGGGAAIIETDLSTLGFYIASRLSDTNNFIKKNNGTPITNSVNWGVTDTDDFPLFLLTSNNAGTPISPYSPYQCAFASSGEGLTDIEATNFNIAVQALQTLLSRNV